MHDKVTPLPKPENPEKPVEQKTRTITLTNRAPIQIIEDQYPIIAQGEVRYDDPRGTDSWSISIRVRKGTYRYIIHGSYRLYVDDDDDACQMVRVGRVIITHEAAVDLCKTVLEVGEEMRSRILNENLQRHVIYAVDACFANMKPMAY